MKSNGTSMKEMQQLMAALRKVYTDVRLLDAETLQQIQEGARTDPHGPDFCYACRHKDRFSRCCAARQALANRVEHCRLEICGDQVAHITARYYEVDGQPYVLELTKSAPLANIIDAEDSETLMSQASGHNMRFYHDPLTGVYNRRYYEDVARASIGPAGVSIMDMDNLKVYNDTYGRQAGDLALGTAANVIRGCIRQTDTLIRYGGDKFLLILPGIPREHPDVFLQSKLEQIRAAVEETTLPGYPHLHLSLSIGAVLQGSADPLEEAVHRADYLMYQAKAKKNAIVLEAGPLTLRERDLRQQRKRQILIVDDSEMNRSLLSEVLQSDYRILEAPDGEKGLELLQKHLGDIALVLLDINMPVKDGFAVLQNMTRNHAIEDIPVIMISSEASGDITRKAYEMGASDFVTRPFDANVVCQRVNNTVRLYTKQQRLVRMVSDQTRKQEHNTSMLVGVLSQIVEFRNGESGLHVQHIRALTEKILDHLLEKTSDYKISAEEQDNIPLASALHDIGKITIDENILNKPGRLTKEEFEVIKTHCMQGANMLRRLENFEDEPLLQTAYDIARWHHERWDGRGYPDGLKGNDIPICAQIVSLADVYDALTSERCYKKAFSHETAMRMILNGECGAFNPLLLECLTDIQAELQEKLQNVTVNR